MGSALSLAAFSEQRAEGDGQHDAQSGQVLPSPSGAAAAHAPTTPLKQGERSSTSLRSPRVAGGTERTAGVVSVAAGREVVWQVEAAACLEASPSAALPAPDASASAAQSDADSTAATHSAGLTPAAACVSPPFAVPPACLPLSCRAILGGLQWCLGCEADSSIAVGEPQPHGLSVFLRALGGIDPRGLQGLSVCCAFQLQACWHSSSEQSERHGDDGDAGGAATPPLAPASAAPLPPAQRRRLLHAFCAPGDECGVQGVVPPPAASSAGGASAALEVRLAFDGLAVHAQGPLSGLVLRDSPRPLLQVSAQPEILVMDGWMSAVECQAVRELGLPRLRHSRVSAGDRTPMRTSWGMFVTGELAQHPTALALDARLQELADAGAAAMGRLPLLLSEATQIVRYCEGEHYASHYDNRAGDSARRPCTVMVYLSDVHDGGTTTFPRAGGLPLEAALACLADQASGGWVGYAGTEADVEAADDGTASRRPVKARLSRRAAAPPSCQPGSCWAGSGASAGAASPGAGAPAREVRTAPPPPPSGLAIPPREGRAVVFWSRRRSGQEDPASLHSADPVGAGGVKWIATRWCKEVEAATVAEAEEECVGQECV